MANEPFIRDERTIAVADRSGHLVGIVLMYGMLIDVVVRGLMLGEACWDLLALVALGGGIATFYQARHRTLAPRWFRLAILVLLIGAVAGLMSAGFALLLMR